MVGKEVGGFLAPYFKEAQRARLLDEEGSIVDQVLGDQITFDYLAASDLKRYSHQDWASNDVTYYHNLWKTQDNVDHYLSSIIGIEDQEFSKEYVTPISIDASYKIPQYFIKDNFMNFPWKQVSTYHVECKYRLKRSYLGDELYHFVSISELAEDISPLVKSIRVARYIGKHIHDVSIGTLFLRDDDNVRKAFSGHGENPPKTITCFNGISVIKGANGGAQEITRDELKRLRVGGVKFAETPNCADIYVGLFGANVNITLSKSLHNDYETEVAFEKKWIAADTVVVEVQPLYKLN